MITFNFVLLALAVLTCLACTVLLFRGYARSGMRLLLWIEAGSVQVVREPGQPSVAFDCGFVSQIRSPFV